MRNAKTAIISIIFTMSFLFTACDDGDKKNTGPVCGDNALEAPEVCDGTALGGVTCQSEGYAGGTLACAVTCDAFDTSGCNNCGNHTIEDAELCDGTDLGDEDCVSQGFLGGTLACAASCGAFDTTACLADHVLPDSPLGEQMAWLIAAVNSGTAPLQAEFEAHFSAAFQSACDYSCFRTNYFNPLSGIYAPLLATAAWVRFSCYENAFWERMFMSLDPSDDTIEVISHIASPDLDPAFGALPATEIGLFLFNPSSYSPVRGVTVELVHRTTGLSFDPPVIGVIDEVYQYVRLAVPAGETEVGVKATHTDGQVTYTYSSILVSGADLVRVPAFSNTAFPYYLNLMDLTLTAGQSQLWGLLSWAGPAQRWSVETFNSGIGCGVITSDPVLSDLYYTALPSYLPTETATQTALQNSTFFAFNADPVAYEFTATATGDPLVVSVPALAPDAITTVYFIYDRATYPENPTAEGCAP
jgi:hypothetical protein